MNRVMHKVLVVDDETDVVELVAFNFKSAGYEVVTASNGDEALTKARTTSPSIILLDVMLPGIDGYEVCRLLRRDPTTNGLPIIMLTARATELSRAVGLESGADAYMTKPFSPRELVVRAHHLLLGRELRTEKSEAYKLKDVFIDVPGQFVSVNGQRMELTASEIKLVSQLTNAILRRLDADWT